VEAKRLEAELEKIKRSLRAQTLRLEEHDDPTHPVVVAASERIVELSTRKSAVADALGALRAQAAILISVNRSAAETSLYEATRYARKISRKKAMQAEVILAKQRGLIVGAFVAEDWLPATAQDFLGHEDAPGRLAFIGREAPAELRDQYVGKRVPDEYRKKGAANPIRYTWIR
jgi:hypothetical protein